jgi:transporter family-2 protein
LNSWHAPQNEAHLLSLMIYILLALLAGTILPLQAAINAALRDQLGHPVLASLASFLIGTCCLGVYAVVARLPFSFSNLSGIEAWKWTGGVLGAVYLTLAVILTPRLGAAVTFGLVITGQLIASVVLDHFGWLGIPVHQINVPRVLGVLLLMAGVVLVRNY